MFGKFCYQIVMFVWWFDKHSNIWYGGYYERTKFFQFDICL